MPTKADNRNKVAAFHLCTSSTLSVKEAMKKSGFSNFEIENENKQRVVRKYEVEVAENLEEQFDAIDMHEL